MRVKKLLSLTLTAAMVMAPMSVSAAGTTSENSAASEDGSYSISSSGSANAVSADHYKVVLPTDKAFDFVLDPQGLLSLSGNEVSTLEDLEATAGGIHPVSTDNAVIQNKSSMPVVVSMNTKISSSHTKIKSVTSVNAVDNGTDANMLLAILPSKVDTLVSGNTYEPTKEGVVLTTTAVDMDFYLEKGNWNVSKSGMTYKDGGSGTEFQIGGLVNKKANWADVKETVTVTSVFKFAKTTITPVYDEVLGAFGLLSANGTRTTSPVTRGPVTQLTATPDGGIQINDASLKDTSGQYAGTYPAQGLFYVQSSSTIDTSAGLPSTIAAGATYGGLTVSEIQSSGSTWDATTGKCQLNADVVNALKTEKAHLVYFITMFDGSILMSNEVVF